MDPLLQFITQPLVIVLIAVGVFVGRVLYLAKRLKSASKNFTLADMRALEEAKRSLDRHRESLEEAKGTLTKNLGGARDTLRGYRKPLDRAVDGRRQGLETSIKNLSPAKELEKIRAQSAIKDAKRLYKNALPRKTHRTPTKEM